MIAELIAILGLIADFAEDHPDLVRRLAKEAAELLGLKRDEDVPNVEALRGLAAGMAAARANAVQEFTRRKMAVGK